MVMIIIAIWLGFLWALVSIGVLKKWHMWMKVSPLIIWLAINIIIFLPMAWTAPSGPVTVLSRSVQIAANVSGVVTEVNISGGQPLKQGDVLFKIDPVPYQAEVDEITAKLTLAKTRLGQKTQLLNTGAGKETDVQQAQSSVSQLTAQLKAANWNLEQTSVKAPTDGFISNVVLQPGARVNTGAAVMPFIDNSVEIIGVQIAQSHLRNIKVDQSAEVIFNLYPGKTFPAKVKLIVRANPGGQIIPTGLAMASKTASSEPFWLALQLDQSGMNIPPGASGTAAVFTEEMPITHVIRKLTLRMQTWANYITGN
jgi:multidrug resistance efflux pump